MVGKRAKLSVAIILLLSMTILNTKGYGVLGAYMTTNGDTVQYSSHAGENLIIEAMYTSCSFCKDQVHRETMASLAESYKSEFTFLLLSIGYQDTLQNVSDFAAKYNITVTVGIDVDEVLTQIYNVSSVPTVLVIDDQGKLQRSFVGVQDSFQNYTDYLGTPSQNTFSGDQENDHQLFGDVEPWVIGTTSFIAVSGTLASVGWYIKMRKLSRIERKRSSIRQILHSLTNDNSDVIFALSALTKNHDGENSRIKSTIPAEFYDYKFLLNPVRLAIVKILFENVTLTSLELRKLLKITKNEYYTHLSALESNNYIVKRQVVIDGVFVLKLSLSSYALERYQNLQTILLKLLESPSLVDDIKLAQLRNGKSNPQLYPNSE